MFFVWENMSVTLIEGAGEKKYIPGVCIDVPSIKKQEKKIQHLLINEQHNRSRHSTARPPGSDTAVVCVAVRGLARPGTTDAAHI